MIKLYFVAIYFIFGYNVCSAQFAVVNDPDGYSNLREAPGKSKIITQLKNGTIVYGLPEPENKWQIVDYSFDPIKTGYIHIDRLDYIDNLPSIPITHNSRNTAVLSDGKITITVEISKFDASRHKLSFYKENKNMLHKIDNLTFLGTDGGIPAWEYKSIVISIRGKDIIIPEDDLSHIYEPNLSSTIANYDTKKNILYLHSANSDGAGGYEVLWIIDKETYKGRHLMQGF